MRLKCVVCGNPRKHDELYVLRDKYSCDSCGAEEESEREITLQELIWQIEYAGYSILPKLDEECESCERECVIHNLLEKNDQLEKKISEIEKELRILKAKE